MKIRYNIANNKQTDYIKFAVTSLIALVLSVLFTAAGVHNLSTTAERFKNEKSELQAYEQQIEKLSQEQEASKGEVERIKKRWRGTLNFCNDIIKRKLFPYLEKLGVLEDILPAGVSIDSIKLSVSAGSTIQFSITAVSSAKLLEAYKTFLKHNLIIKRESISGGLFRASLQVTLKK